MSKNIIFKKKLAQSWFKNLQNKICNEFQEIEIEYCRKTKQKPKFFKNKNWKKSKNGGGGSYSIIRNGAFFDSVGVNFSMVSGKFEKKFRSQILGATQNPNYWASGISVVAHFKNPKIPALHFNTRFITTSKNWFGGGMDATPAINDYNEKKKFHEKIKFVCDKHNKNYYPRYKKWCDNYFYLPHRKETRGIGGIFFDYKKDNWEKDFNFVKDIGLCFLNSAKEIIRKKMYTKWSQKEKEAQLYKRGRYIEFNLLYDKGTKFGLSTGGNVDAILMSLPPKAKWK
ncbi:MAG: coproporphyrinogen III oxidase [Proteobacteria bacterium TMED261]|nr:MAG: coproporphyrinogen III oxidase [Proteobacteria bacterium TMED261]